MGRNPEELARANELLLDNATHGNVELIREALARGADPDAANEKGTTALMSAVRNGKTEAIKTLIAAGADLNKANDCGDTPLCFSVRNAKGSIAELLIEAGARVNPVLENGKAPLQEAASTKNLAMLRLLLDFGAEPDGNPAALNSSPLIAAAWRNWLDGTRLLLERGANPNHPDEHGNTPLCAALSQSSDLTVAELLIAQGADVNAKMQSGDTLLILEAKLGNVEAARLLLSSGADPVPVIEAFAKNQIMTTLDPNHGGNYHEGSLPMSRDQTAILGMAVAKHEQNELSGSLQRKASEQMQPFTLDVLAACAQGKIDLNQMARAELAQRGCDAQGKWVGFDRARDALNAPKPKARSL